MDDLAAHALEKPSRELLEKLLGRPPRAEAEIVVRSSEGRPLVIRNSPLMYDGTPMPTRYWLVDPELTRLVGRLESNGGVHTAEQLVDAAQLRATHAAYASERDAAVPADHDGPRPFGGVGGTRVGVKCLHAHYAYWLAGGADPVGAWVDAQLHADAERCEPSA